MSEAPIEPWSIDHTIAVEPRSRRLRYFTSNNALPAMIDRSASALGITTDIAPLFGMLSGEAIIADLGWLKLDDDPGEDALKALKIRLDDEALPLIIEVNVATVDPVWRALCDADGVTMLFDPDEGECLAALARSLRNGQARLHSPMVDERDQQLERLQEEVHRIARLLARLSLDESANIARMPDGSRTPISPFIEDHQIRTPVRGFHGEAGGDQPAAPVSAAQVRLHIRHRRLREEYFGADLFADPAWDMMLDLYAARLERLRVSVSSLCIASAVPATTALRWIKTLTEMGVFERREDQLDGRRIFVALSDNATQAMHGYFRQVARES